MSQSQPLSIGTQVCSPTSDIRGMIVGYSYTIQWDNHGTGYAVKPQDIAPVPLHMLLRDVARQIMGGPRVNCPEQVIEKAAIELERLTKLLPPTPGM